MEVGMTFSLAVRALCLNQSIQYSTADGEPTGLGSMKILEIDPAFILIQPQNGKPRRVTQKDWDEVDKHWSQLLKSGTHRQYMHNSRNVTYVLSIRAFLELDNKK
jgi:hypothetical protein